MQAARCSCASLMSGPCTCTEWHIYHSTLFSGFLCTCSVAFLPQALRSESIGFRRSRRAPSPTRLCTGAMRSDQLFSIHIVHRFTLGAPQLHKCSITLCWCTKYPSKNNLPLPLLARKWDNRQSDGETITAVSQWKFGLKWKLGSHYCVIESFFAAYLLCIFFSSFRCKLQLSRVLLQINMDGMERPIIQLYIH